MTRIAEAFRSLSPQAQRRWSIVSRTLASVFGAYAVTSLFIIAASALARGLGAGRAVAVLAATQVGFVFYAVLIMAGYHVRSARRAWLGLLILGAPLGLVAWALA